MSARVILLVLLGALLSPLAVADHVYSHRYVVEGRLVDDDGLPLPGRLVKITVEGDAFDEPCRGLQQFSVTNEYGDFAFCFHKHALGVGTKITASAGNATATRPIDIALRRTVMMLREPNETGLAPPDWQSTYRISGRAWEATGPVDVEGVEVIGLTPIGLPVNLTIHTPDGPVVFATRTDPYGDYDIIVTTDENPDNLSATLEARGRPQPVHLDAFYHRATSIIYLPAANVAPPQVVEPGDMRPAASATERPGASTPPINPLLIGLIGVALFVSLLLARRARS